MNVVTRGHIYDSARRYPDAADELFAWYKAASEAQWRNLLEVCQAYADADSVDGFLIFNVRHNRYRLVTIPHYARLIGGRLTFGHLYVRSFLTHKEYDSKSNWNRGPR